jgi:hypothetical protein
MVNVAATDPYLAGRFSPADLAEVVAPKVQAGDSASSYFDRVNGIDREQLSKDGAEATKGQLAAEKAAWSQQIGIDMDMLQRKSGVPWQTAATLLSQDPNVQAAIDQLSQAAGGAATEQEWQQLLRQARAQLDPQQYAVVSAVMSLG